MGRDFKVREEIDLKPCPFCGGEAYINGAFISTCGDEVTAYFVGCEDCEIRFAELWDYKTIVEKWNKRIFKNKSETPELEEHEKWRCF